MSPGTTSDGGVESVRDPARDGSAARDRDARSDRSRAFDGGEMPIAERRRRLQALAELTVRGSDGETVGRVRDIYPLDAGTELAAITVMPRQLSAHAVLIPASAIASLPEVPEDPAAAGAGRDSPPPPDDTSIHLLVDTATAKAGARPPLTLHATPEDLQAAAAALGLGEGSVSV